MVAAAPQGREGEGVHALYATHLAILLREAAPQLDAQFTAEALLATLAPSHHLRLRHGARLGARPRCATAGPRLLERVR